MEYVGKQQKVVIIIQIRLLTALSTDGAQFDVYLTDQERAVSVVKDSGTVSVSKWATIREALAFLCGAGCEIDTQTDGRQLIDKAVTAKYATLQR